MSHTWGLLRYVRSDAGAPVDQVAAFAAGSGCQLPSYHFGGFVEVRRQIVEGFFGFDYRLRFDVGGLRDFLHRRPGGNFRVASLQGGVLLVDVGRRFRVF